MHMLQSLFYLTTALHVSGVTITYLQEHKTTVANRLHKLCDFCILLEIYTRITVDHNFNVHGSMHPNNILLYKSQQDAHVTEFILSD
jgi:hypothetical protein